MSSRFQRVLVVQDALTELSVHAIRWAVDGLALQAGDKIKLLRVVQPFTTASTSSFLCCGMLSGYKNRTHSSVTIKKRQESIEKEITKNVEEFNNNEEIKDLLLLMITQQIEIERVVEAAHSLKEVTVQAAKNFDATCVILDRKLRKDLKYIMDNLSCGILRMKHDKGVEFVRAPKAAEMEDIPQDQLLRSHLIMREQQEVLYQNSYCSGCGNKRPRAEIVREFTYSDLQFATSGFSQRSLLSKNRPVFYEGTLPDGTKIVVRRRALETISETQFKARVQLLGKARHENVTSLLGSFSEGPERLLVYEYVCNDSLNAHLSKKSKELTWERRMRIAMGTAKGLQYLHSKSFYGNMRPNNILITHDYEALLTNYGITRKQYEDSDHSSGTRVLKTFEYLAPEYEQFAIESSKTDVYAFGVVLLELVTGRKTIKETCGRSFLRWARPLLREKCYEDLIDPALEQSHDIHQLFWIVRLAEKCLSSDPYKRYSIDEVVNALAQILQGCSIKDYSPPDSVVEQSTRCT